MSVFIDFDNTITLVDVLYQLIERFSISDDWRSLEHAWLSGEITTKECLTGQMRSVRISSQELSGYLTTIEIDPYFSKLIDFFKEKGIELTIVSDNFEPIINFILEHNGIKGVPVFANELNVYQDRLLPSFPFQNPECLSCAHCKKIHFMKNRRCKEDLIIYVGDGRSDICPAKKADIVFAKSTLLNYFKKNSLPCFEFLGLADVYKHLNTQEYKRVLSLDGVR